MVSDFQLRASLAAPLLAGLCAYALAQQPGSQPRLQPHSVLVATRAQDPQSPKRIPVGAPEEGPARPSHASTQELSDVRPAIKPVDPTAPAGAEVMPIDLPSALRLAGVQNPTLGVAFERTLAATATQQLAAARLLPNLNGGANFDHHVGALQQASGNILSVKRDALYVGAGAGAVAAGTVPIPGVQYNLNLSDSLFTYLVARPNLARTRFAARAVSNDLQSQVAQAYGELLRAEGRRAILLATRADAQEVARVTADFARVGQGRAADAERARTEFELRDAQVLQADADVAAASARLGELLNLQSVVRLHAAEPWVVPRSIVPDPIPLPELLAIAVTQRPELADRREAINAAFLELRGARLLPFSPQLLAGYSAGEFGGGSDLVASSRLPRFGAPLNGPRFGNFDPRADLDVVMYWTLRNLGVGNMAMISAAQSRLKQSDLESLATLNQVQAEVARAFAEKQAQLAELDLRQKAVETSGLGFQEDLTRTRANVELPIEVLDSLRLLYRARVDYLNTIVDYNLAHFALYTAIGQPPADLLVRPAGAPLGNPAGEELPPGAARGPAAREVRR